MSASEPESAPKSTGADQAPTEVKSPVAEPAVGPDGKLPRGRRYVVRTLLVLGTVLGILALLAVWVNRQALNADNWANTSSSLLENSAVRGQVSNYIVDQIYENVDVTGEIKTALPKELKPFAGTAAGGVENLANQTVESLLSRPFIQEAWKASNRMAMEQLIRIVEEKKGGLVESQQGSIYINLHPLITSAVNKLGLPSNLADQVPADAGTIKVLTNNDIAAVQSYVKLLRGLGAVLPFLTFLLFALALLIARGRRRQTLIVVGADLVIMGAVVLALAVVGRGQVVNAVATTDAVRPAVEATWNIATEMLRNMAWASILTSIPLILAAVLAGPSEPAVATRRFLAPWLRFQLGLAYGVVGVLVILLIVWGPLEWLQDPLPVLVMILLVVLGMELLRRQTAREYPNAELPDVGAVIGERTKRVTGGARDAARKGQQAVSSAVTARLPDSGAAAGSDTASGGVSPAEAPTVVAAPVPAPPAAAAVPATPAAPAAPPAATEDEKLARLERLSKLYERGHLTDEEFAAQKKSLLAPPS